MGIAFNHTIVHSRDRDESARFFTEIFGLSDAVDVGPFLNVELEHGGNLDFATAAAGEINHNDGGRGVYFQDPSGHYLEIITRPYGSGEVSGS